MNAKKLLYLSVIGFIFTACNAEDDAHKTTSVSEDTVSVKEIEKTLSTPTSTSSIEGIYVGDFEAEKADNGKAPMMTNRINLSIDSLVKGVIYGYSVVAGNIRPFKGTYVIKSGIYEVEAKEPGDDQYDGVFSFVIDLETNYIKGRWLANNKELAVTERSFIVSKTVFSYDPKLGLENVDGSVLNASNIAGDDHEVITEDAGKINASVTLLKKGDVENMYKRDLEVMRNAIYARHGYSFKNRQMRDFFDKNVSWYIPVSVNVSNELTELEKTNIALIKRYEKHAETYYDAFGR